MADKVTVKIATVGQKKNIPKKGKQNEFWTSWGLQFEDDGNWYDTFWLAKEDPVVGQSLTGTKTHDEQYGWKFDIDRGFGNKSNWNPAAAQATVMLAAVEVVNGFLALPTHYELWDKSGEGENGKKLKDKFSKYLATVDAASKQLKEKVVAMGALSAETKKTETNQAATSGDPGPTPPPNLEEFPADQEPVDL